MVNKILIFQDLEWQKLCFLIMDHNSHHTGLQNLVEGEFIPAAHIFHSKMG